MSLKPHFRSHWSAEDIRALVREELTSAHVDVHLRKRIEAYFENHAPESAMVEIVPPRKWWQFGRSKA